MNRWMIYGANGYTGQLIAEAAQKRGHQPILAGRHPQRILELSQKLGLEGRIFDLRKPLQAARQLQDIDAVLHCAGPFSATSRPMLDACIKNKVHYLDITGEIDVFESIFARTQEIRDAGIAAIPGVGFDVVPSDCLAVMLKERCPEAKSLTLAFKTTKHLMSPGTAKTVVENLSQGGRIRENGKLVKVPSAYKTRLINFAQKNESAMSIPWGDVATAWYSTGIPHIEFYLALSTNRIRRTKLSRYGQWLFMFKPLQTWLKSRIERNLLGPSLEERQASTTMFWGEVKTPAGQTTELRLRTPEGYTLTASSAVAAMERVLSSKTPLLGALTPATAFGSSFVTELEGVEVIG